MSASVEATATGLVDVHRGRRGRVAVMRLPGLGDLACGALATRAADEARGMRARWVVLDLSQTAALDDVTALVEGIRRRLADAGVRLAVVRPTTQGHRSADQAGLGCSCPAFDTVPIALGTLGTV